MLELLIALGIVGSLGGATLLLRTYSFAELLSLGSVLVALGMVVGVPLGTWYHVELRRALLRVGPLPTRWWLRPVAQHDRLDGADWPRVRGWFFAGGIAWMVVVAGCCVAALAVGRALLGQ